MKKILILSTIWGHLSIAKGVRDSLEDSGNQVHLENIKLDSTVVQAYRVFYRLVPSLFKTAYKMADYGLAKKLSDSYFERGYQERITKTIKKHKPDMVINTYFGYMSSIEKLKKKYGFEFINIIPDPRSFSKILATQKGTNIVFDTKSLARLNNYFPKANNIAAGWFVERKFFKAIKKPEARKLLGLDDKFTITITGGSEGTYDVLKFLASLVGLKRNFQAVFMCGSNSQLYSIIENFSKVSSMYKGVKIIPQRYTERMEIFLKASDIVVGKAGPNTIFESVAALRPFIAISHISGQEDGNLEIIKKYKIGYVEENPVKIAKVLKAFIEKPKKLEAFEAHLEELSRYIQGSKQKLLKLI